jgi:hypothetical protein
VRILLLAAVALAFAAPTPSHAQTSGEWVAFEATFVRVEPGERKVVGFFHRASDGSTREESNPDGSLKPVVLIMNFSRRLQYRYHDGEWHSFPIFPPPGGWRPEKIAHDPRIYRPAPAIEKIDVLRFVNPQGLIQFLAPALNDFPLKTQRPNGGYELFSNLVLGDQSPGLFEPPPGDPVRAHIDGAGAIYYSPGDLPSSK